MFRARRLPAGLPLALIALALFLRVLVPAGWMPSEAGFGIRPCTQIATVAAPQADTSAHHHHEAPQPDDEQQVRPCTFTALGSPLAAAPQAGDGPLPIEPAAAEPSGAAATTVVPNRLAAPPPPQRGPPLFA